MKTLTKAALIAATIFTASSAQAVSYIRYDVATTGTGALVGYQWPSMNSPGGNYAYSFSTFNFSYIIALDSPITALNLTNSSISYGAPEASYFFITGGSGMTVNASTISFLETVGPSGLGIGSFRASACLADSRVNQFPTGAVAITPGCGSVEFNHQLGKYANMSFTGTIASITGTAFEGGNVLSDYGNVGLIATFVPESSSWLLMIAGFGMIGATMRYRRRFANIAYA